jgi:hypothetical protein
MRAELSLRPSHQRSAQLTHPLPPSRRSGLGNNAFGGTLPDFLGTLPALTALQLNSNYFTGARSFDARSLVVGDDAALVACSSLA